ncbi:MAG: NUDIX hydrolase [Candidatus Micrarchaeaceae archaeon]
MRTIYKGKLLELDQKFSRRAQGKLEIVKTKDAAVIVPVLNNKIVIEKQYRAAINKYIYELPAGHIEKGESPEKSARRELEEETGYTAGKIKYLVNAYSSPGILTERLYFYLATDLKKGKPHREPDELIELRQISLADAIGMIRDGTVNDMKTIAGLLFYSVFYAKAPHNLR